MYPTLKSAWQIAEILRGQHMDSYNAFQDSQWYKNVAKIAMLDNVISCCALHWCTAVVAAMVVY